MITFDLKTALKSKLDSENVYYCSVYSYDDGDETAFITATTLKAAYKNIHRYIAEDDSSKSNGKMYRYIVEYDE